MYKDNFCWRKTWKFFKLGNYLYINISSPFTTMKKLKGVFKLPKCRFWCGKKIKIPIMYYITNHSKILEIVSSDVLWKDKYDTPRFEESPYVAITLFNKYSFIWRWSFNPSYDDDYWEQALWYLYYYKNISCGILDKPDIEKAKKTWPWADYYTQKSTWNDKYLVKNETKR